MFFPSYTWVFTQFLGLDLFCARLSVLCMITKSYQTTIVSKPFIICQPFCFGVILSRYVISTHSNIFHFGVGKLFVYILCTLTLIGTEMDQFHKLNIHEFRKVHTMNFPVSFYIYHIPIQWLVLYHLISRFLIRFFSAKPLILLIRIHNHCYTVYIYIHIHTHTDIYIYTYIYIHIYIRISYIYIHTVCI